MVNMIAGITRDIPLKQSSQPTVVTKYPNVDITQPQTPSAEQTEIQTSDLSSVSKYEKLDNGEYVDKDKYDSLTDADKEYLKIGGVDAYNEYKGQQEIEAQRDLENNYVKLSDGAYVKKDEFNELSPSDQQLLIGSGVAGFDDIKQRQFRENNIKLNHSANGENEYVDRKYYESLPIGDREYLSNYGIDKFNEKKQKEFEAVNTKLEYTNSNGDNEWVSNETYNSLLPIQQSYLNTNGIDAFQDYSKKYIFIKVGDPIEIHYWDSLSDIQQNVLYNKGMDEFRKFLAMNASGQVAEAEGLPPPPDILAPKNVWDNYLAQVAKKEAENQITIQQAIANIPRPDINAPIEAQQEYIQAVKLAESPYYLQQYGNYLKMEGVIPKDAIVKGVNSVGELQYTTPDLVTEQMQQARLGQSQIQSANFEILHQLGYVSIKPAIENPFTPDRGYTTVQPNEQLQYLGNGIIDTNQYTINVQKILSEHPDEYGINLLQSAGVSDDVIQQAQDYINAYNEKQSYFDKVANNPKIDTSYSYSMLSQAQLLGLVEKYGKQNNPDITGVGEMPLGLGLFGNDYYVDDWVKFLSVLDTSEKQNLVNAVENDPAHGSEFAATVELWNTNYQALPLGLKILSAGAPVMLAQMAVSNVIAPHTISNDTIKGQIQNNINAVQNNIENINSIELVNIMNDKGYANIQASAKSSDIQQVFNGLTAEQQNEVMTEYTRQQLGLEPSVMDYVGAGAMVVISALPFIGGAVEGLAGVAGNVLRGTVKYGIPTFFVASSIPQIVDPNVSVDDKILIGLFDIAMLGSMVGASVKRVNTIKPTNTLSSLPSEIAHPEIKLAYDEYAVRMRDANNAINKLNTTSLDSANYEKIRDATYEKVSALNEAQNRLEAVIAKHPDAVISRNINNSIILDLSKEAGKAWKKYEAIQSKIDRQVKSSALVDAKLATDAQKALAVSKLADEAFINRLSGLQKIDVNTLRQVEKLSGYDGLAKQIDAINKAQIELKKAWDKVDIENPTPEQLEKLAEAKAQLQSALDRYGNLIKVRIKISPPSTDFIVEKSSPSLKEYAGGASSKELGDTYILLSKKEVPFTKEWAGKQIGEETTVRWEYAGSGKEVNAELSQLLNDIDRLNNKLKTAIENNDSATVNNLHSQLKLYNDRLSALYPKLQADYRGTDTRIPPEPLKTSEQISMPAEIFEKGIGKKYPEPFGYTGTRMGELGGATKPFSDIRPIDRFLGGTTSPLAGEEGIPLSSGGGKEAPKLREPTSSKDYKTPVRPVIDAAKREGITIRVPRIQEMPTETSISSIRNTNLFAMGDMAQPKNEMTVGDFVRAYPQVAMGIAPQAISQFGISQAQVIGIATLTDMQLQQLSDATGLTIPQITDAQQQGILINILTNLQEMPQVVPMTITKPVTTILTEAQAAIQQATQIAPDNLTIAKINEQIQNLIKQANDELQKNQIDQASQTANEALTQAQTATQTATQVATQTKTQMKTQTKTETITKNTIMPKSLPEKEKIKAKVALKVIPVKYGTITARQGRVWWILPPNEKNTGYDAKDFQWLKVGETPDGVWKIATGKGSAKKTLQILPKDAKIFTDSENIPMGWAKLNIKSKGNGELDLSFAGGKEAIEKRWAEERGYEEDSKPVRESVRDKTEDFSKNPFDEQPVRHNPRKRVKKQIQYGTKYLNHFIPDYTGLNGKI